MPPPSCPKGKVLAFWVEKINAHGSRPVTEDDVKSWFEPTDEEIKKYEGKVLVITEFEQGKNGLNDRNVISKELHEFLCEENPTFGFYSYKSNDDFEAEYLDNRSGNGCIATYVIDDPVEIAREMRKPCDPPSEECVELEDLVEDDEHLAEDLEQHRRKRRKTSS